MKHEWRKHEKALYGASPAPALLDVPCQQFILIDGEGDPNQPDFSERVAALYTTAYAIKRIFRSIVPADAPFHDFTVYPLEGLWLQNSAGALNKAALRYAIMIRQPDAITPDLFAAARAQATRKKDNPHYDAIRFEKITDGASVQLLHSGSYDDEPHAFAKIEAYLHEKGLVRTKAWHREIYLSNPKRVAPEKRKTILRVTVQPKETLLP